MPRIPKPDGPEGTVWFGGEVERAKLTFRILGDDLDPPEITALLGRQPSRFRRKGDPIFGPTGEVVRTSRIGSWIINFDPSPEMTVDEAIVDLLTGLTEDESVWKSLTSRFKIDLICYVFVHGANQGLELPLAVVQLIARRNITLGIDIFPQPDDKQAKELRERLEGTK